MKTHTNQPAKWWQITLLGLTAVALAGMAIWLRLNNPAPTAPPAVKPSPAPPVATPVDYRELTSTKGVKIRLNEPRGTQAVSSPLSVSGEVPGNWSFEASFPVELTDGTGKVIASQPANLEGDWMTENYVPFSATLTFDQPPPTNGQLILRRNNPSGLPENEDAAQVSVTFQP